MKKKCFYLATFIRNGLSFCIYLIIIGILPNKRAIPNRIYNNDKLEMFLKAKAVRMKPILTKYKVKAASL
jgi:hypothetical protein